MSAWGYQIELKNNKRLSIVQRNLLSDLNNVLILESIHSTKLT